MQRTSEQSRYDVKGDEDEYLYAVRVLSPSVVVFSRLSMSYSPVVACLLHSVVRKPLSL